MENKNHECEYCGEVIRGDDNDCEWCGDKHRSRGESKNVNMRLTDDEFGWLRDVLIEAYAEVESMRKIGKGNLEIIEWELSICQSILSKLNKQDGK